GWTSVPTPTRGVFIICHVIPLTHPRSSVVGGIAIGPGQRLAHLDANWVRASSRRASALSSLVFSATASSLPRLGRALASMRFSPADKPRSLSLRQRSRTTSAALLTSPDANFSRLAL